MQDQIQNYQIFSILEMPIEMKKVKNIEVGEMFMNLRDISSFKAIQPQFIIKSKEKCKKGTTNK